MEEVGERVRLVAHWEGLFGEGIGDKIVQSEAVTMKTKATTTRP